MARNRHHNDNMKVTFSSHQFPEVSRVLKDSFNAPCSIHFNHAAKGHYSYLLLGDDDDVVTLTGKSLVVDLVQSTAQPCWIMSLMWIRGHGGLGEEGAMKSYFIAKP